MSISALEDWDFVTPVEIPQYKIGNFLYKNSFLGNITGTISNQMERTMSSVQKAIGKNNSYIPKPPDKSA